MSAWRRIWEQPTRAEANRDEAECLPSDEPLTPEWQAALNESTRRLREGDL